MKLRQYQRTTIDRALAEQGRFGIFNDVGTGKTVCALVIASKLKDRRILLVAPLAAVDVWRREIEDNAPKLNFVDATVGSIVDRRDIVRATDVEPTLIVVNYETYWKEPLRAALLRWEPTMVIFDEAHRIKGYGSRQARFSHILGKRADHRLALTATPMTKGPEDLFSIFKFVNSEIFGTRWQDFAWEYVLMGGFQGRSVVGYRNRQRLERKLHAASARIPKSEALDLEEEVPVPIEVRMSATAKRHYDDMRTSLLAEVEGLKGETGLTLARIAATAILRLKQITSGFVKTVDGEEVDISHEKLDVLTDLLSDLVPAVKHVVVFCHFRRDVARATEAAEALRWDKKSVPVWVLSGGVSAPERTARTAAWTAAESGILVCQIAVSSVAIDLTAAHVAIYYSVDYSLINWIQSHGRLHRFGQTNKVTSYYLITKSSVDVKVYRSLQRKQDLTESVLDLSDYRSLLT